MRISETNLLFFVSRYKNGTTILFRKAQARFCSSNAGTKIFKLEKLFRAAGIKHDNQIPKQASGNFNLIKLRR